MSSISSPLALDHLALIACNKMFDSMISICACKEYLTEITHRDLINYWNVSRVKKYSGLEDFDGFHVFFYGSSWVPYESGSEWLANGYLPELWLMELESFDWEMAPKLTPKEYAFLLKLNFASKCPAFVKNTNHAQMSFHIILESGVRSTCKNNVCNVFLQS
ncbi:hypothetical protein AVEN_20085-1 [Araneus ventricosus]|uniref:Uncharacterized protein n=1 Tax=Araneus ventricosus TaxID=182803 RepID=A0A4Y2V890_ARAVE|nr:hypothetical protein AVEN_20085-1 [Araneus ventricosus]